MAEDHRGSVRRRTTRDDRGAIFVEFAAMVPFMMLALALVWQVLLVGVTSMYASHGAAEAARQASVTPDDMARIDEEARKRVGAPWDGKDVLTTEIVERDGDRFARVSLDMPVFLPGVTAPWPITGEAKVVTEVRPRGTTDPEGVESP